MGNNLLPPPQAPLDCWPPLVFILVMIIIHKTLGLGCQKSFFCCKAWQKRQIVNKEHDYWSRARLTGTVSTAERLGIGERLHMNHTLLATVHLWSRGWPLRLDTPKLIIFNLLHIGDATSLDKWLLLPVVTELDILKYFSEFLRPLIIINS